jgi:hypothetical protein
VAVRIRWLENPLVSVPEEAKREAERALARVDLGGLGGYKRGGSFAPLYMGEGLLLKLAKVRGVGCSFSQRFGSAVASSKSTLSARWRGSVLHASTSF